MVPADLNGEAWPGKAEMKHTPSFETLQTVLEAKP